METRKEQMLIEDAMILMSGDMFYKIYELKNDLVYVTNEIKLWARKFVHELKESGYKGDGNDEKDFIIELENFEEKNFNKLKDIYSDL